MALNFAPRRVCASCARFSGAFLFLYAFSSLSRTLCVAASPTDLESLSREALLQHARLLEFEQASTHVTQASSTNARPSTSLMMRNEPRLGPVQSVEIHGNGQIEASRTSAHEAADAVANDMHTATLLETPGVSETTRLLMSVLPMEQLSKEDHHDFVHSMERDPAFAKTLTGTIRRLGRSALHDPDPEDDEAILLQPSSEDTYPEERLEPEIAIADLGPEEDNTNGVDWTTAGIDTAHAAKLKTEESVLRMIKLTSVLRHKGQGDPKEEFNLENELIDGRKGPHVMQEIISVADSAKEPVDDLVKLGVALRAQDLVRLEKYELGMGKDLEEYGDGDIRVPEAVVRLTGPPRTPHSKADQHMATIAGTPVYSPHKKAAHAQAKEAAAIAAAAHRLAVEADQDVATIAGTPEYSPPPHKKAAHVEAKETQKMSEEQAQYADQESSTKAEELHEEETQSKSEEETQPKSEDADQYADQESSTKAAQDAQPEVNEPARHADQESSMKAAQETQPESEEPAQYADQESSTKAAQETQPESNEPVRHADQQSFMKAAQETQPKSEETAQYADQESSTNAAQDAQPESNEPARHADQESSMKAAQETQPESEETAQYADQESSTNAAKASRSTPSNPSSLLSEGTRESLRAVTRAWPLVDGQYSVKYCRGDGLGSKAWAKFQEAAGELHEHCELLQFVEVADSNTCELRVRGDKDGCWSHVGYSGDNGQINEINLKEGNWWSKNFEGTCAVRGIVEHEILHTLGLRHEQAREDRGTYVALYPKNVMTFKTDAFQVSERPQQQNFSTHSEASTSQRYDVGSIMHVGCKAFSKSVFADTVRANRRRRFYDGYGGREDCAMMGQRQGLVMTDVLQLREMYGNCEARRRRAAGSYHAKAGAPANRRRWY